MSTSLLDIDLIPTNIVIYKAVEDDFIFIALNKMALKTENLEEVDLIGKKLTEAFPGVKEFGLFDILQRVHVGGESEVLDTAFYEDSRISGWRHNEVKKLDNVIADPAKAGAPTWMLNRRKDYEDGSDKHVITGDLKFALENDIKRLKRIKSYIGMRHGVGLPVRGQRTKSNLRRNKGKSRAFN